MRIGYLRRAHELLFSLNIALVAKLQGNQKPNKLFSLWESGEASLQSRINAYLHLYPHHHVGSFTAFFIYALGPALCLFLLLRALSGTVLVGKFLRSVAGIVSLVFLPISWLCVAQLIPVSPLLPNPPLALLASELLVVSALAVMYLYASWPLPAWWGVAILLVHFAFWDWLVSGGPYFWRDPFRLVFPLAGFFSTLVWGAYVSRHSAQTAEPTS